MFKIVLYNYFDCFMKVNYLNLGMWKTQIIELNVDK